MAITISKSFETGSILLNANTFASGTTDVYLDPRKSFGGWWMWWNVLLGGVNGLAPVIHLRKANSFNPYDITTMNMAWWGTSLDDPDAWQPFDHQSSDATYLNFWNDTPFPAGNIYVARYPPITASRIASKVAGWITSPFVSEPPSALAFGGAAHVYGMATARTDTGPGNAGESLPALPHYCLKISDPAAPDGGRAKKVATIVAGIHQTEMGGFFEVEAMVDFLLGASTTAARLRREFTWYVYPMLDPQGNVAGYYRTSPSAPLLETNQSWDTTSVECDNLIKAALTQDVVPTGTQVMIECHSTAGGTGNPNSYSGCTSTTDNPEGPEFMVRMTAIYPTWQDLRYPAGSPAIIAPSGNEATTRSWSRSHLHGPNAPDVLLMKLLLTAETGANKAYRPSTWRTLGQNYMVVVDSMAVDGWLEPPAAATSTIVLEQRDRVVGAGTFTTLPTLTVGTLAELPKTLTQTRNLSALANGDREYQCRTVDQSDGQASPWVSRLYTVANVVVPPPDPPPAGAWFAINGIVYEVLAEGVDVLQPEAASGSVKRMFSGRSRSTVDGAIDGWRIPLNAIIAADHATLRAAIRRQRRITVGGNLFGPARAGGFAATVTLDESAYEWVEGGGFERLPVLTVKAVDRR